jgi:hypothetical protein
MLLFGESEHPVVRQGMVSEVSFGGIGLYLVRPLEVGVKVNLEIRFMAGGGAIRTVTVKGTTVYCKFMDDIYYVGVKFNEELNPKLHPNLYSRIQNILESF